MKRCPECRRDYYDDSLLYCLDDGIALLAGPASGNGSAAMLPGSARFDQAPSGEACLLAAPGEKEAAVELFSRAVDEHSPMANYVNLPCFDGLRGDPRFETAVDRLRLPGRWGE